MMTPHEALVDLARLDPEWFSRNEHYPELFFVGNGESECVVLTAPNHAASDLASMDRALLHEALVSSIEARGWGWRVGRSWPANWGESTDVTYSASITFRAPGLCNEYGDSNAAPWFALALAYLAALEADPS